jgi:hypothetical protein
MADAIEVEEKPAWMADAVPVAETPAAKPKEDGGWVADAGDWVASGIGDFANLRENARSGAFKYSADRDQGFWDRFGDAYYRGGAGMAKGFLRVLEGMGSPEAKAIADDIQRGITGVDIVGKTEWQDFKADLGLGTFGGYVTGAGAESLPMMATAILPYVGLAGVATSQTGNIAEQRTLNDGRDGVTGGDLLTSAPAGITSAWLERLGMKGMGVIPGAGIKFAPTALGRIGQASLREGLTEAAQSGIEYSGGTVGTKAGWNFGTMLDQMLAGGLAGAPLGGAVRTGVEGVNAVLPKRSPAPSGADDDAFTGSLDEYMRGQEGGRIAGLLPPPDWMADAIPQDETPALPSPVAYADGMGDTGMGASGLADLERSEAARRVEAGRPEAPRPVDDGGAVARSIFGDAARITSTYRDADHPLSKANPKSWHTRSHAAVDMAPIEGMTFEQAKAAIEAQGYTLIEALNETGKGKSKHATGYHWHFVIGEGSGTVAAAAKPDGQEVLAEEIDMPMPEDTEQSGPAAVAPAPAEEAAPDESWRVAAMSEPADPAVPETVRQPPAVAGNVANPENDLAAHKRPVWVARTPSGKVVGWGINRRMVEADIARQGESESVTFARETGPMEPARPFDDPARPFGARPGSRPFDRPDDPAGAKHVAAANMAARAEMLAKREGITLVQAKRKLQARERALRDNPRLARQMVALPVGMETVAAQDSPPPVGISGVVGDILRDERGEVDVTPIVDAFRGPASDLADKVVDTEGLTRDAQAIKNAVGNPVETLKRIASSNIADNARAIFYSADSRFRAYARRYDSPWIDRLADTFHARAGQFDEAVGETWHEAVEREGYGRAQQAWRILEPFAGDKAAQERIAKMLRVPEMRQTGRRAEAEAAAELAALLKDTIDYRRAAGEEIGEVTTGYLPRIMNPDKVLGNRDMFLLRAVEIYRHADAANPRKSAEAWMGMLFDKYTGLDGGLDYIDLFHDKRPAGVGRSSAKARKFGADADKLLADFYETDLTQILTSYFVGAARKAEEARRFGPDGAKLERIFDNIRSDLRKSGKDAPGVIDTLSRLVATNLGRVTVPPERVRSGVSFLHTAGLLGTLDRATVTSLSEAMMGFVRAGPRYGVPMLIDSAREFGRALRHAPPTERVQWGEALGVVENAMMSEALTARSGIEASDTGKTSRRVLNRFFRATGLHQWTAGTRAAAVSAGHAYLRQMALDMDGGNPGKKQRAEGYLRELGVKDTSGFASELLNGGKPALDEITRHDAGGFAQAYRTAMLRFVNQTIMRPTRAQKPRWASHPLGGLFFSLMSYSYGFKKNVLDRAGRMTVKGVKEGDPSLLYPAFGLAALFAVHTAINSVLRPLAFGGGREDDEEGWDYQDTIQAVDRAGITGAASPLVNAVWGVKYKRGLAESFAGVPVGRPLDVATKMVELSHDTNSPNTNSAERKAAEAIYDVAVEPTLEAYGLSRLKGAGRAAAVWGTGNRDGGVFPSDREWFVSAVAGPKEEKRKGGMKIEGMGKPERMELAL